MGRIIPESEIDRVMQYGIYASREEARRSLESCDDKWTQLLIYEIKHVYRMGFIFRPSETLPFRNYIERHLEAENSKRRPCACQLASTWISRKLSRLRALFSRNFRTPPT